MQFRLQSYHEKCSGCRACQLACSEAHGDGFNPTRSRMFVVKDDVSGNDLPIVCRFCDDADCVAACPTDALTQTVHGWLALNNGACTSCGACTHACPYNALRLDPSSRQPLACDGCGGGAPLCVAACVTGALEAAS